MGLSSKPTLKIGKKGKRSQREPDPTNDAAEEDEDEDDEAELHAEHEAMQEEQQNDHPTAATTNATDDEPMTTDTQEPVEEAHITSITEDERRDLRMDAFLNDPELGLKVFFSSFYTHKGLCWYAAPISLPFYDDDS